MQSLTIVRIQMCMWGPVPSVVSTEDKQYQQQEQQQQQQTTTNKPQLLWFVGSLARASP